MLTCSLALGSDMYRLKAAKYRDDVDPRELPTYTPADVARFLGVNPTTLHHWVFGRTYKSGHFDPVIEPADPENKLLSFFNLAELHVLAATRYEHKVKFDAIRTAMDTIQKKYPSKHPLISADFFTNGKDIFLKKIDETENLSTPGQTNLKPVLDMFLKRIKRDKKKLVERIYPVIKGQPEDRVISIVHGIASGQPIIDGRGIPVFVIYARKQAGESNRSIAKDFGIAESKVKRAIDYVDKRVEESAA